MGRRVGEGGGSGGMMGNFGSGNKVISGGMEIRDGYGRLAVL